MKVQKRALKNATHLASMFTSSSLPVTAFGRLRTLEAIGCIESTDLDSYLSQEFPVEQSRHLDTLVPLKPFALAAKNALSETVELAHGPNEITVVSDGLSHSMRTGDVLEFPAKPTTEWSRVGYVDSAVFKDALSKALISVAKDGTRPLLSGINMIVDAEGVLLQSTDGFRATIVRIPVEAGKDAAFTIDHTILKKLVKILDVYETELEIGVYDTARQDIRIAAMDEQFVLVSRQIEGKFPQLTNLMPENRLATIETTDVALLKAVTAVLAGHDQDEGLMLSFDFDFHLEVSMEGADTGRSAASVFGEVRSTESGEAFVMYNPLYLRDALLTLADGKRPAPITIDISGKNSASQLRRTNGTGPRIILMPMHMPARNR